MLEFIASQVECKSGSSYQKRRARMNKQLYTHMLSAVKTIVGLQRRINKNKCGDEGPTPHCGWRALQEGIVQLVMHVLQCASNTKSA